MLARRAGKEGWRRQGRPTGQKRKTIDRLGQEGASMEACTGRKVRARRGKQQVGRLHRSTSCQSSPPTIAEWTGPGCACLQPPLANGTRFLATNRPVAALTGRALVDGVGKNQRHTHPPPLDTCLVGTTARISLASSGGLTTSGPCSATCILDQQRLLTPNFLSP